MPKKTVFTTEPDRGLQIIKDQNGKEFLWIPPHALKLAHWSMKTEKERNK